MTNPDLILNNQVEVPENQVGFVVGTFATKDPDANDTFTYSLVFGIGSDNAKFVVYNATNELKTAVALNYTQQKKCIIRAKTSDNGGLSYEKSFSVNVKKNDTSSSTTEKKSTDSSSNSSIIGIIGGAVWGILCVLGGIGGYFYCKYKKNKKNHNELSSPTMIWE